MVKQIPGSDVWNRRMIDRIIGNCDQEEVAALLTQILGEAIDGGNSDGEWHKQYALDQIVRLLLDPLAYQQLMEETYWGGDGVAP